METFAAIAHILGAIVSLILLGLVEVLIGSWESTKNEQRAIEEVALALGVGIEEVKDEVFAPKVLRYSSQKYSSELFVNRFSDFCGVVRTIWGWFSNFLQVVILLLVIWTSFPEDYANAVYAWVILVVAIASYIVSIVFSYLCKLLTGRFPGEAKQARKAAIAWVNNKNELFK
jgi:hypothetical protein